MQRLISVVALVVAVSIANAQGLKEITFDNGKYDGKVPVAYQPVVKAITSSFPKATFSAKGEKLSVNLGVKVESFSISHSSDCPVNSQYQLPGANPIIAKVIRPVLVAWTQIRHDGFEGATVARFNQSEGWAEVVLNKPDRRVGSR